MTQGKAGTRTPIRVIALSAMMLAAAIVYVTMVRGFDAASIPAEAKLGESAPDLRLYIWPLSIDIVNADMPVRIDFTPGSSLRDGQIDAPDRDLKVTITDERQVWEVPFKAGEPMASVTKNLDLAAGDFASYPFDRYYAELRIKAHAAAAADNAAPLRQAVTVWQGMPGFILTVRQKAQAAAGDFQVVIDARRSSPTIFFAVAVYAAMGVLGAGSLIIGALAFLRRRRLDVPLIGAAAAMVFALPVLRNALPGAPPLGVAADMLVFLWAELAAVIGLLLLIATWATDGPPP